MAETSGEDGGRRHKRNAQATREALLSAARRRFATLGFERTTTRDVAADADVNVALINRYFGSKEGLFEACLGEPASARFRARLGDGGSIAEGLADQFRERASPGNSPQVPLMLWLQGSGDARAAELRSRGIEGFADAILEAAGGDPSPERRLRAQLVLALGLGVVTLRGTIDLQPLTTVSADELIGPLDDAVVALLGPTSTRRRGAAWPPGTIRS
jgi:AcrR family transcriptional regulator